MYKIINNIIINTLCVNFMVFFLLLNRLVFNLQEMFTQNYFKTSCCTYHQASQSASCLLLLAQMFLPFYAIFSSLFLTCLVLLSIHVIYSLCYTVF
jgi:hypothetical protein